MRVIFLDVDGVLNSNQSGFGMNKVDPQMVARLEKLVQATGAKIVISSSWRSIFSLNQIKGLLRQMGAPTASHAVIDRTPVGEGNRGQEIQEWLELDPERAKVNPAHEGVQAYVILDDTNEMTPQQQPNMVQTNPQFGLTDADVAEAISILRMA